MDSITTTSGTISITHGTEGAAHDPYHYEEYHWEPLKGHPIHLRLGVGVCMRTSADQPFIGSSISEEEAIQDYFWNRVGMKVKTFHRALDRLERGPYAPEDPMTAHYGFNI